MSQSPSRTTFWTRLIGEFLVIVVGVLVALGVDNWAGAASDRRLEREYLERLLEDVQSDLLQYDFVADVSAAGTAHVDSLLSPGLINELEPDRLVGAVFIAYRVRGPAPARPTFQELVSSGRIGLIRSRAVRTALVEYEEAIAQTEGYWEDVTSPLADWVRSRVPPSVEQAWNDACGEVRSVGDLTKQAMIACPFDLRDWDAGQLRRDLQTAEARSHLTLHWWRHYYGRGVVAAVREAAVSLRDALKTELGEGAAS
ncbi:MAG: hypothetical protein AMS21_05645 [Gemmatimonas sp. SG8_38_2]|jgi:hypothetical protein|nr:MAG: hypothetical protein AMS21_05645 [Gemmatimonas sp. SG8_38_2]